MDPRPTPAPTLADVEFLRELVARTRRRVDPHAFHFVLWGALVAVWFPLSAWFESRERWTAMAVVGACAVLGGSLASWALERRLAGRSRLEGEDVAAGRLVGLIVAGNVGAGVLLSVVAPAARFVSGPGVPILWGLVYASLAFHVGLAYSRAFLWGALAIFLVALVAMAAPVPSGYLLGPAMGAGLALPGLAAERRVRRMRDEDARGLPGAP